MTDFEKLGLFYLGRELDPNQKSATSNQQSGPPLLYDASDLVTHAVIAGMTGSGKTGLGIDLIEDHHTGIGTHSQGFLEAKHDARDLTA